MSTVMPAPASAEAKFPEEAINDREAAQTAGFQVLDHNEAVAQAGNHDSATDGSFERDPDESPKHEFRRIGVTVDDHNQGKTDAAFDIVCVHGLHGECEETWRIPSNSPNGTWLGSIFSIAAPRKERHILYDCRSSEEFMWCFTSQNVYREAKNLLEMLRELRTPEIKDARRTICFLCHDIGGLVVKAALILASYDEPTYADILHSTGGIVFFGYPHRFFTRADLEEQVFRLLSVQKNCYQRGHMMRLVKSLASTINEVNDTFIHTKMLIQALLVNIFSTHEDSSQRVFDEFTATMGIPFFEHRLPCNKPHLELTHGEGSKSYSDGHFSDRNWLDFSGDSIKIIRTLLYQASPIYPALEDRLITDNSELESLTKVYCNRILHIQCTSGADVMSERVRNYLDARRDAEQMLLYFRFKGHDIRFNTIRAMLWTFCAQIAYNGPITLNPDINGVRHGWATEGLFELWQRLVTDDKIVGNFHVLGCLDECDDSALWFLSLIRARVTRIDCRMKIVIITTKGTAKDKLISDALSKFPPDSMARIDYSLPSPVPVDVGFEMSMLLQENPRYAGNGLQDDVTALISGFSNDESLCRLLINWLKSNQESSEPVPHPLVKFRTPSPELVFETLLADVSDKHQLWAQKILSWMLSAFRPLRAFEFCRISDLCLGGAGDRVRNRVHRGESNIHSHLTNILRYFGGLLVLVHDEVHFAHASTRSWLKSQDREQNKPSSAKEWYRQRTERDRQVDILQICLEHLRDDTDLTEVWVAQLPYATQFWASHYKQTGPIEDVLETIFEHQPRFNRWANAYMALQAHYAKPTKISPDPLPIAAHFGLEDIVGSLLIKVKDDAKVLGQALVEASRMAQLSALRLIIESYPNGLHLDDIYVKVAVDEASYCGSLELYRELINHITEPHVMPQRQPKERSEETPAVNKEVADDGLKGDNSEDGACKDRASHKEGTKPQEPSDTLIWLTRTLRRTSWMGVNDIITKLLWLGADPNPSKKILEDGFTPLHFASRQSQLDAARLLIASGASLIADVTGTGSTPLHYAAVHGSGDITKFLLEQGAPIDIKGSNGLFPLQLACQYGNFAAAECLLKHRNFREYLAPGLPHQPLIIATMHGHYKVVETLLRYGAEPNITCQEGRTALWHAVYNNRVDLCRLLLAHKADPGLTPDTELSPLLQAVRGGRLDIVRLLVENGADIGKKEGSGFGHHRTPMHMAIHWNQPETVQYLLSQGADPQVSDAYGNIPLVFAAQYGYSEIVRMLAEAGANVHSQNDRQWTPLHIAYDFPETVRVLLEYGADINKVSEKRGTPLDLAISNNQPEVIKVMISKSKNKPDLALSSTQEALRDAVRLGYIEVVSLILEAGADVNLVNDNNESLTSLAMPFEDESLIRTILEYYPDLSIKDEDENTALHQISDKTPAASVRLVVNAGGKLDAMNKFKETPLIRAISAGNIEVVRYLLTKKLTADTLNFSPSNNLGTPLQIACWQGTLEMTQLLIKNGSDINVVCASRFGTPLIAATTRVGDAESREKEQIVKLLLEEGADPTLYADQFGYPIISASLTCSLEIVQWFLDRKVSIDVKDIFGRKPVHVACYNSLKILNVLGIPDSDFAVKDLVGRVPLHYAVLSGQLDLVEEVLARSERVGISIDVQDNDGWTPLLWAARASHIWTLGEQQNPRHDEVVSFLLDKKANTKIHGRGLYQDWTSLEVAYYHNADSIADLIVAKDSPGKRASGPKKRGKLTEDTFCDCCYLQMSGVYFQRADMHDFYLCFKCYRSKSKILPRSKFNDMGYDWDSDDSSETSQSEPARSINGEKTMNGEEDIGNQFDSEVVDEDDLKEIEMDLLDV